MARFIVIPGAAAICFLIFLHGPAAVRACGQLDDGSKKPIIGVGGNILESKLRYSPVPLYPELARRARIAGTVILQATVDEQGLVSEVKIIRGHPLLGDAAVEVVRQRQYEPVLLNGEPVSVIATVTLIYNLGGGEFRVSIDDAGALREASGQLDDVSLLKKMRERKAGP